MIVSEVMPPPDHHDDPTTQHETWFLLGRQSPTAALSIQFELRMSPLGKRYQSTRRFEVRNIRSSTTSPTLGG
jgi:hypothetical protein